MTKTELIRFELDLEGPAFLPCWNIAQIRIGQTTARTILGSPHYVEKDSRATAGGTEDHWTYMASDKQPAFFRLRVPYEQMDICFTHDTITSLEKTWLQSLFGGVEIQYHDEPWDENAHPENAG